MGMDRNTGRGLSGWPHVMQSLLVIWTTALGEREMLGQFGSGLPGELGKPLTEARMLTIKQAINVATDMWEPRYAINRVTVLTVNRDGRTGIRVDGQYRPRGHLGDLTPEGPRSLFLGADGMELIA